MKYRKYQLGFLRLSGRGDGGGKYLPNDWWKDKTGVSVLMQKDLQWLSRFEKSLLAFPLAFLLKIAVESWGIPFPTPPVFVTLGCVSAAAFCLWMYFHRQAVEGLPKYMDSLVKRVAIATGRDPKQFMREHKERMDRLFPGD